MRKLSALFCLFVLSACASMPKPEARDAKRVLDTAVQVCAFRDSLPAPAVDACAKLDDAAHAAREAAKAVLANVPETK